MAGFFIEDECVFGIEKLSAGYQLSVLDIRDPDFPTLIANTYLVGYSSYYMIYENGYGYIASAAGDALHIVEVSRCLEPLNLTQPGIIGTATLSEEMFPVDVLGDKILMKSSSRELFFYEQ